MTTRLDRKHPNDNGHRSVRYRVQYSTVQYLNDEEEGIENQQSIGTTTGRTARLSLPSGPPLPPPTQKNRNLFLCAISIFTIYIFQYHHFWFINHSHSLFFSFLVHFLIICIAQSVHSFGIGMMNGYRTSKTPIILLRTNNNKNQTLMDDHDNDEDEDDGQKTSSPTLDRIVVGRLDDNKRMMTIDA